MQQYANHQSPDGPAMTFAIFSVVANEVSPSGCSAYTYAQYSYDPYMRAPFFQMSEQLIDNPNINGGTNPAYPFLTGHGGANQVVLFGYLGLRLLPDNVIHVDPNMPPQIPHVDYRTFYWRGWPLSASSNYTHTTISRATNTAPLDTADPKFAHGPIPVHVGQEPNTTTYQLPAKGPLTIPNRQVSSHNTVAGNLVQCRPVQSPDDFEPGQFPISAVDGATSTLWRPSSASKNSSVTVTFPSNEQSKVSGFHFDWAQAPPVNATVVFHNVSTNDPAQAVANNNKGFDVVLSLTNIQQSNPFNPAANNPNAVVMPQTNTTDVQLNQPVPASRFASLLIIGNQELGADPLHGTGATVAEWAILGNGGSATSNTKRALPVRDAAALENLTRRRKSFNSN